MRTALALFALLPACVVPYAGPGDPYAQPPPAYPPPASGYAPAYPQPPGPPPPGQRRLTREEAVQAAFGYAAQHGVQPVGVHEVEHEGGAWKVELELAGGGEAKVVVDAWTGAERRFKVEGHGHHRGGDRDEDDD